MNLITKTVMLSLLVFTFFSCEQEDEIEVQEKTLIESFNVSDQLIINKLKLAVLTGSNGRMMADDFNWDNVTMMTQPNTEVISYAIPSNSDSESFLGIYEQPNKDLKVLSMVVSEATETTKTLSYKSLEGELLFSIRFDKESNSVQVQSDNLTNGRINEDCGNEVTDCIQSVYEESGRASVAAIVISSVEPPVGIGIVAGCIIGGCFL